MDKYIIEVPEGIRYISEWEEFNQIFPKVPHIMDKSITGCGFTEWCITNSFNVILCSPRNILLDNKAEQHPGEVYRVVNDYFDRELGVDKDTNQVNRDDEDDEISETEKILREERSRREAGERAFDKIYSDLSVYSQERGLLPRKILVTYDSFHIVKSVLEKKGALDSYFIIIDEFQSVFTDSRFKASTELEFIGQLQGIEKVCFLSATPMMDGYLNRVPEFSELPYYELDWNSQEPGRVESPDLLIRTVKSIYEPAARIIADYKNGNFKEAAVMRDDGTIEKIQSKEAVFYVNSVNNICRIIEKNQLKPEECNILCARTDKNLKTIQKKLKSGKWNIGKVPLEGEPRKMFTFCTRTVYLGADFYSDNACSFILSDANIECLAVDISLDLPQIMGRQRLSENPWKNYAEFYYKPFIEENSKRVIKMTQEEFDERIDMKIRKTEKLLENYESAPNKVEALEQFAKLIKFENYKDNYIGINKRGGKNIFPEINHLVMIAEQRAYDIQQVDYKDRFKVLNAIYEKSDVIKPIYEEANTFFYQYNEYGSFYERLKFFCEYEFSCKEVEDLVLAGLDRKTTEALILGKDRLRALSYRITGIKKELSDISFNKMDELTEEINLVLKIGDRVKKSEAKELLLSLYRKYGYNKNPKASDLSNWFNLKEVIILENGKRIAGFELSGKG